jgi:type IV secretory pathway VirJ component
VLRACLLIGVAAFLGVGCETDAPVVQRDEGRFGRVSIHQPTGEGAAGLFFLFSDRDGWNAALDRTARALARESAAVVGVDLPQYLRGLAASDDECHYLISEVEDLSKRVQRELGFAGYRTPVLAGIGAGGTLAYAALAQSPAATVAGAISVDPASALGTTFPLCAGAPSRPATGGGFRYGSTPTLPGWWEVSPAEAGPALLDATATPPQGTGAPVARLLDLARSALARESSSATSLADLPLVELPSDRPSPFFAVIYSGDGGWRDIDKEIGETLAESGVPVVGVDSLRYFWTEKTPDRLASDLTLILSHYSAAWQRPAAILVGYSFGAGILPFAFNRLPPAERARIALVALLGVEHRASFEFDVTGWLGGEPAPDAPAVLPELKRFPPGLVQCFFGEEEEDTVCRDPALQGAEIVRTTGGHHFDGDYESLAERILDGARRRRTPGPHPSAEPTSGSNDSP